MSQFYPAHGWVTPQAQVETRRDTMIDWFAGALAVFVILIFSQGWIAPIFGPSADEAAGGIIRLMYFPAYLAGLILLAMNAGDTIRVLIRQPVLIFMLCLVAASITWSISPSETVRRGVAITFTSLAGVSLAARFGWPKLVEVLAIAFGIQAVLSLALAIGMPSLGRMPYGSEFPGAWRGIWTEKNSLGDNMALYMPAFIAAAIYHPRRRWLWAGMALLCFGLVVMSTSKTSLLGLILAAGAITFVALVRRGPALAVTMTYLAVLTVFSAAAAFLLASDVIFALLGKDATLTGRTEIWAAIMTQVEHHPWFGHGYGTVWTVEGPWTPLAWIVNDANFRPHHAHSSWFEQLLGLGIVGLCAWILFFSQTVITGIIAAFREKGAYLALPFLVVYALISVTESITLAYNDVRWVLFVAIACKLAYPDRLRERA